MRNYKYLFVIGALYGASAWITACGNNNEPEKNPPTTTTSITKGTSDQAGNADTLN